MMIGRRGFLKVKIGKFVKPAVQTATKLSRLFLLGEKGIFLH